MTTTDTRPLDRLAAEITGELALPGSSRYAALTSAWNVATEVRPAAVVAAATAADVVAAVRAAAAAGLRVAVQATGHGGAAVAEDTLLVQTGALDEVTVFPSQAWVRVGAGVRWKAVLEACVPYGLAPLNGSSSDVGVVGYTTGGGLGPMARTFGLASDSVRALEVVTGEGELLRVTPDSEPDLFWALRGGKGALGVVTAVELDLVPVSTPYAGALYFDGSDAAAVLHAWREWAADLPDSVTTSAALLQLPPLDGVPPVLAGRLTVAVRVVHVGEAAEGERLVAPMRAAAPLLLDGVGVLPYAAIDVVHSDPVDPMPVHEEGFLLRELTGEAVDRLLEVAGPGSGSPLVVLELRQLGGAVARGGRHASAVCHRDHGFGVLSIGLGVPPFVEPVTATCAAVASALATWTGFATLPNFGGGTAAYDPPTLARLRRTADRYDPQHLMTDGASRLGR